MNKTCNGKTRLSAYLGGKDTAAFCSCQEKSKIFYFQILCISESRHMVKEAEIMVDMGIPPPSIPSLDFSGSCTKTNPKGRIREIFLYAFVGSAYSMAGISFCF
jgi:hypothetical protein